MSTWHLSLRPDTDTDTDTDVDVNINASVMPALGVGVGIGIGVESQHLQIAENAFHLSILDNRVIKFRTIMSQMNRCLPFVLMDKSITAGFKAGSSSQQDRSAVPVQEIATLRLKYPRPVLKIAEMAAGMKKGDILES